ncbi:MAG TPA: 30S ribosome-binding factor RbfA [Candidatus Acidoferrales bacterium]|nr:30S ribosome-binding factor RbfA [Candidatus Acidoferrales bacterium]
MTVAGHRPERIAEEIRNEVSLMLAGELKDPRLSSAMNVTEVRVTPDLKHVRVYVEILGTDAERQATLAGLAAASGFIRHELTERLHLRRAPDVFFVPDRSEEYGQHIEDLIKQNKHSEGS